MKVETEVRQHWGHIVAALRIVSTLWIQMRFSDVICDLALL